MKEFIFVILILSVTAFDFEYSLYTARECPKYSCGANFENPNACSKQIMEEHNVHMLLRECKENEVCDIKENSDEEGVCAKHYSASKFLPGEFCTDNSECLSTVCKDGVCVGKGEGEQCEIADECNPGLMCHGKLCNSAAKENDECDAWHHVCQANLVCDNGHCVKIGSKKKGEKANAPGACETLYVHEGVCTTAPTLLTKSDVKCTEDTMCEYEIKDIGKFSEKCVCGMTKDGEKFCNPGRGDAAISDYMKYVKNDALATKCHVKKGPLCMYKKFEDMGDDFYKAYVAYMKAMRGASFLNNEDCVKKIINKVYWDSVDALKKEEDDDDEDSAAKYVFLAVAIIVVFITALILFIIYFKKRREEAGEGETTEGLTTENANP